MIEEFWEAEGTLTEISGCSKQTNFKKIEESSLRSKNKDAIR